MYQLNSHPDFPSTAISSIGVDIERPFSNAVVLRYRAEGQLTNVLMPDEVEPGFQDGLWRHSCFEAFLGLEAKRPYTEFNLSPSGRYAAYHFDDHREGMRQTSLPTINHLSMMRGDEWIELAWLIQSSEFHEGDYWQLGLSAVIEATDGTKSYWALAHPPGPPDFHNRDCFIATLPPPAAP